MSFYKRELKPLVNYKIFTTKNVNQNNKPILHLKFFIMTCSKYVKYVFVQKRITATCKLQNIYKEGCKSKQQTYPTLKILYHDLQ